MNQAKTIFVLYVSPGRLCPYLAEDMRTDFRYEVKHCDTGFLPSVRDADKDGMDLFRAKEVFLVAR
ncbi:MAG: hypothetical protein V2G42_00680 [bacterium JZ-2024 1]